MRVALYLAPWLLAGGVCAFWVGQSGWTPSQGLALGLWAGVGLWVLVAVRKPACGVLRWDGQDWHWETAQDHRLGSPSVRLDWQQGLLLEFQSAGRASRWLWLTERGDPAAWGGLRRALSDRAAIAMNDGTAPSAGSRP